MVQTTPLQLSWRPVGVTAVTLYLPQPTQPIYPQFWLALIEHLTATVDGIIDTIPAYCSLFVDGEHQATVAAVIDAAQAFAKEYSTNHTEHTAKNEVDVRIPVCYHDSFAPDLAFVAKQHNLSTQEVINYHTSQTYLVYALGFIPGFAFLGYVNPHIATPRRQTPRANISAGSVGIAGQQTGVYPAQSPGGWQIIGRSPMTFYDPDNAIYSLFDIASSVRFYEISLQAFHQWAQT